jgi:hypothetical protein
MRGLIRQEYRFGRAQSLRQSFVVKKLSKAASQRLFWKGLRR